MKERRTIRESLELINLLKEDYRDLVQTPEGCLEILKRYLPHCEKRYIPFDNLVVRLDNDFFRLISTLPKREYKKYINLYNSIIEKYKIPPEDYEIFAQILKEDSDSALDDLEEPSDLELRILERISI